MYIIYITAKDDRGNIKYTRNLGECIDPDEARAYAEILDPEMLNNTYGYTLAGVAEVTTDVLDDSGIFGRIWSKTYTLTHRIQDNKDIITQTVKQ